MPHIEIHQDKAAGRQQELVSLCPFGAIENTDGKLTISAACRMCRLCIKKGDGVFEFVEDSAPGVDKSQWKGIAVVAEIEEGDIHPVTFELIGKAKEQHEHRDAEAAENRAERNEQITQARPEISAVIGVLHEAVNTVVGLWRPKLDAADAMSEDRTHHGVPQLMHGSSDDRGYVKHLSRPSSEQYRKQAREKPDEQTARHGDSECEQNQPAQIEKQIKHGSAHAFPSSSEGARYSETSMARRSSGRMRPFARSKYCTLLRRSMRMWLFGERPSAADT